MKYGIWMHIHRNASGHGDADLYNGFLVAKPSVGSKLDMVAVVQNTPWLSSSHRSFTILARTPDLTDEGPNVICEQCGGPTRRTRDMMTVAEIWRTRID